MAFEKELDELKRRKEKALQMGGTEKIKRRHDLGKLTARERIDQLLDAGSFVEIGMLNYSDMPGMEDKTPADSKIGGFGKIEGRTVVIMVNDFTVLAATSSRVSERKEAELREFAEQRGYPVIYLGEGGGGRMPDIMGSKGMVTNASGRDAMVRALSRVRKSPMVAAIMGECYGMPTWMACVSDIIVQLKGSAMAVSGPRVLELAIAEKVTSEDLGGWKVHAEITGNADRVAENEGECFAIIRKFLSYMPSHCNELPPLKPVPEGSGSRMERILELLPEKRNRVYDMNKILATIVDGGELFPLKPLFGKSVITSLARVGGWVIGIIANQPMFNAGAMDTDGIDKVISFICLCDSFNIPLLFFHDIPGFLVGKEAERKRVAARAINYMNALNQVTVAKISIIVRKSYGLAFWNMGGYGSASDFLLAWPTAEVSFMDPEVAANVVFGGKLQKSPELSAQKEQWVRQMIEDSSPYPGAGLNCIHDVIDPRETRNYIMRALEICHGNRGGGIGEHRLANWPTKF